MDFSEMMGAVRQWLSRAGERAAFVARMRWKIVLPLFLVIAVGATVWARSGFTLDFFRSQAAMDQDGGGDGGGGGGAGTSPLPSPSGSSAPGQKRAGWFYCDYRTKAGACAQAPQGGIGGVTTDYDAPDCSSATDTSCTLGQCRKRAGNGLKLTDWVPADTPANLPACEPISKIDEQGFPGFGTRFFREGGGVTPGFITPQPMDPAPTDFPDCLYLENGYSTADPNFGTMNEHTVPEIGPTAKLEYKAFVINNCPWEVHLVFLVDGGPKAEFNPGVIGAGSSRQGLPESEVSQLITEDTAPSRDFQSCWNFGLNPRQDTCGKMISIKVNMNTYTCGSVGLQMAWWHRTNNNAAGGQNAIGDSYCDKEGRCEGLKTNRGTGFISVLNYGKDCTGAPGERAPGRLGAPPGGGACPPIPAASAVKPANLTVQCGTTQNVLTWQNPKTLNAAVNSVLRGAKPPTGNETAAFVWGEGGCWNTFGISTYTDKDVKPGYTYRYVIKTHPAVRSNEVFCKDGVQVTPTPGVSSSPIPEPSGGPSPAPTVITPTPFTPGGPGPGDSDGDGVPDSVECPNGEPCPDTDGDGTPDWLDTDSDNDGIPDGQDCNRLVAGTCGAGSASTVQTGPGEATLLALIVSAVVALLYASYTHSPVYKQREAEEVSRDQEPMDFKS